MDPVVILAITGVPARSAMATAPAVPVHQRCYHQNEQLPSPLRSNIPAPVWPGEVSRESANRSPQRDPAFGTTAGLDNALFACQRARFDRGFCR